MQYKVKFISYCTDAKHDIISAPEIWNVGSYGKESQLSKYQQ